MSRTDKDAPDWADATWWEPSHYHCAEARHGHWHRGFPFRECDLPARPVRSRPNFFVRQSSCIWVPVSRRRSPYSQPPGWFVNHQGTARARVRERTECGIARQEYRATGSVDIDPNVDQHRHGATWDWC